MFKKICKLYATERESVYPGYDYILSLFRSLYGLPADLPIGYGRSDAAVRIRNCGTCFFEGDSEQPDMTPAWKEWKGVSIPFPFPSGTEGLIRRDGDRIFIEEDILASAFFFLSGWQERIYMKKNSAFRYPFERSYQHRHQIVQLPVVNVYFDILRSAVETAYGPVCKTPSWKGHPMSVCLTHDIDMLRSGWIEDGWHALKNMEWREAGSLLLRRVRGKDAWSNLEALIQLEKAEAVQASYFFLPQKSPLLRRLASRCGLTSPANSDYSLPDLKKILDLLRTSGCEVGLHGSIGSHRNKNRLSSDLERIGPVQGIRFHYLGFDPNLTWQLLEDEGLIYDSTLGFAEQSGFRNGFALPFYPYDFERRKPHSILEIPLVLMDSTLRTYLRMDPESCRKTISSLMDETLRWNGCFTVLWHNTYFTHGKYRGWEELYRYILEEGRKRNAFMTSGTGAASAWRERSGSE